MKTLTRFNKSLIYTLSAAALVVGGMFGQIAVAGDMFSGTSTICAIAPVEPEIKPNGFVYTSDFRMYWYVETDHELMNGPVTVYSYSKLKTLPSGKEKGWYWGESTMVPELATDGTLEETFRFRPKDAAERPGTFYGTGEFEGVTVEFVETEDASIPPKYCDEYPPCVYDETCIPVADYTGLPPYSARFEGVVFGYDEFE